MEVNNIDDLIQLVEDDILKDDKIFCEVVFQTLNIRCLLPDPISKETKLRHLKEWKSKCSNSEQKPLFFVDDPFINHF